MNTETVQKLIGLVMIGMGLAGLHWDVEYAGWVLFLGIVAVL